MRISNLVVANVVWKKTGEVSRRRYVVQSLIKQENQADGEMNIYQNALTGSFYSDKYDYTNPMIKGTLKDISDIPDSLLLPEEKEADDISSDRIIFIEETLNKSKKYIPSR